MSVRLAAALTAGAAVVTLAACDGGGEPSASPSSSAPSSPVERGLLPLPLGSAKVVVRTTRGTGTRALPAFRVTGGARVLYDCSGDGTVSVQVVPGPTDTVDCRHGSEVVESSLSDPSGDVVVTMSGPAGVTWQIAVVEAPAS